MTGLLLRGGRVLDPSQGLDEARDVVIRDGRVEALLPPGTTGDSSTDGLEVRDITGAIVTPGLVDLHGHWYQGSAYGIEPSISLRGGVTTAVDAGTAGFVNFGSFRRQSIDPAPSALSEPAVPAAVRVLAFVNVAALGIPYPLTGELEDLRYARPRETAALIRDHRDVAVGVKVRLSAAGPNTDGAMSAALEAAELASVPVMVDIGSEGDHMPEVLDRMRPGDILTHCFTPLRHGIHGPDGRIAPEAWRARERGVHFDVGHGAGSFGFQVARAALAEGFPPDSISTDLHRYSIEGPVFDQLTTMSKLIHLGLALAEVVAMSTTRPAAAIGLDPPSLRAGARADLAVFRLEEGPVILRDAEGGEERADRHLTAVLTIVGGQAIDPGALRIPPRRAYEMDHAILGRAAGPLQDGGALSR